jgi:hypothetical protein
MDEPNQTEIQRFQKELQPLWDEVRTILAVDRPPAWEGFRFEARIQNQPEPGKFTIECKYGDRVSNRTSGGVLRGIVNKLAGFHASYLDFSPMMAWWAVTMEKIWEPKSEKWSFETRWEY